MLAWSASHESAIRSERRESAERLSLRSSAAWVRFQTGTAAASSARPFPVSARRRLRRSASSIVMVTSPRRSSGFRFAVRVVRSIASSAAILPSPGGSGWFNDISSENCPLVSPSGRSYFFQGTTISGITFSGQGTYHRVGFPQQKYEWNIVLGG